MERTMRNAATLGPEALDGWQCYFTLALPVGRQSVYESLPQGSGTLRSALTTSARRLL